MVLHRNRQHGSSRFFQSAKQLSKCSFISRSLLIFAAAQRNRILKLQTTGIDSALKEGCFLKILISFHSLKVKLCGRTTQFFAGLHCQDQKGRPPVLDGGILPLTSSKLNQSFFYWRFIAKLRSVTVTLRN